MDSRRLYGLTSPARLVLAQEGGEEGEEGYGDGYDSSSGLTDSSSSSSRSSAASPPPSPKASSSPPVVAKVEDEEGLPVLGPELAASAVSLLGPTHPWVTQTIIDPLPDSAIHAHIASITRPQHADRGG